VRNASPTARGARIRLGFLEISAAWRQDPSEGMERISTVAPMRESRAETVSQLALSGEEDPPSDASRWPHHTRALERHIAWARDFAAVGDIESALEELLDVRALSAERMLSRPDL
jgi:hypothetical protein